MRSTTGMLSASSTHGAQSAMATRPRPAATTNSTGRASPLFGRRAGDLLPIGDAIGGAVRLIGDEQRAVRHRVDVSGPTVELVFRFIEQPGQERLDPGGAVRLRSGDDDIVTIFFLSVPRAVAGNEG